MILTFIVHASLLNVLIKKEVHVSHMHVLASNNPDFHLLTVITGSITSVTILL